MGERLWNQEVGKLITSGAPVRIPFRIFSYAYQYTRETCLLAGILPLWYGAPVWTSVSMRY